MSLRVEIDVRAGNEIIDVALLSRVLVLAGGNEPTFPGGRWTIVVRLTDDSEISDLHQRFFNDPSPTDVITFPRDLAESGEGHLGDIVISVETAVRNAEEFGQSPVREIAFLGVHGILHLCGFDDSTPADQERMLARQEHLLVLSEEALGLRL